MSLRLIPAGSAITRAYYAVPGDYTVGETFTTWDDAVRAARARRAQLVAVLTESLAGYATSEQIEQTADAQVVIDLRWVICSPTGAQQDTVVERYKDVTKLRTAAEVAA